jgi:gluconolactonase
VRAAALERRLPAGLRTVATGLDHPEAVCVAGDAVLAGGEAGQLYRCPLEGGTTELVAQVPGGFLTGIAVDADGTAFCCDVGNGRVQRITPAGDVTPYGPPIGYPNYPVFGSDGTLWVTDSGDWERPSGGIVRIAPGGSAERLPGEPLRFANGLALRGDALFVVESAWPGIVRVPLDGGAAEPILELPGTVPDGLAFDEEGGLWIACWQPNRIYRLARDGALEVVADDWSGTDLLTPTNLAFAGEVLVVASLGGQAISAFDAGVRGAPLHRPRVPA